MATVPLCAGEGFRDDFTTPGVPVTWRGGPGDTLTISSGQLVVEEAGYEAWAGVNGFTARNLSVEAQFQILAGSQGGIYLRSENDYENYLGNLRRSTHPEYPNRADIWRQDSTSSVTPLTDFMLVDFDPDGEVVMRLEAIGDNLSLWVWPAGTAQPLQPIATAQDGIWTDGGVGIWVVDADGSQLARIAVDYFEVTVFTDADFDFDGDVDGDDFLTWQAGFNVDGRGDADRDGDTDGDDFLIWQSEFGSGSRSASAAVPEPTVVVLLSVMAAVGVLSRRARSG